jgi:plasmid stabilization system protein ParE
VKRFEVRFLAAAAADLDELFCHVAKEFSLETADRYLIRSEQFCFSLSTHKKAKRAISAAGRKRIAAAQLKRWARQKKAAK